MQMMHLFAALFAQMIPGVDITLSLYAIAAFVVIGVGLTSMILFTKAKLVGSAAVKLFINDDPSKTLDVEAGQTLLGALTENGIPVPSPCGGKATCKQCKVQILDGAGELLETDKATFTNKELKAGWRLSCQCKLKHDMKLHVEDHLLGVEEIEGTVISNENVATFIKELVVEVPEEIPYRSGGYQQFHVPQYTTNTEDWKQTMESKYYDDWEHFNMFGREIKYEGPEVIRAYSMASYPAEGKLIKFNIRIASAPFVNGKLSETIPWGLCSSYTFGLKPGDKVKLSGPYGESFMIDDDRELVFLIGGAGSSFGRSHILHLFNTENTKRKVTMWYGARSLKENIYQEEYEKLDKDHENFKYNLVLSEPQPEDIEAGWDTKDPIKTSFLFKAFEEGQLKKMDDPEECLYYVCGPPMHNSSVMKLLDDYGVPRESVILDDFGS